MDIREETAMQKIPEELMAKKLHVEEFPGGKRLQMDKTTCHLFTLAQD